jgi:hypothetical protein
MSEGTPLQCQVGALDRLFSMKRNPHECRNRTDGIGSVRRLWEWNRDGSATLSKGHSAVREHAMADGIVAPPEHTAGVDSALSDEQALSFTTDKGMKELKERPRFSLRPQVKDRGDYFEQEHEISTSLGLSCSHFGPNQCWFLENGLKRIVEWLSSCNSFNIVGMDL